MLDANSSNLKLAIIGTGTMGRGIAQIAVLSGIDVYLFDTKAGAAEEAKQFIHSMLERLQVKKRLSEHDAQLANSRLTVCDALEGIADSDIIIEAIIEKLSIKQQLFSELEALVSAQCILATNTSSLSVTAIASGCQRPERVCGFHFFNPVPLMKIVEVIPGLLTDGNVTKGLLQLGDRMGHQSVLASDTPGFIVNHAGRGFGTEALRIVDEGIADFYQIDKIMTKQANFRMGPFELMDLTGLDVSHPVMESIYNQYYQEPRFRPSTITEQRLQAGVLGRKTQRGFYQYEQGQQIQPKPEPFDDSLVGLDRPIWVSSKVPAGHAAVKALLTELSLPIESGSLPSENAICIVTPLGKDATTCAIEERLNPEQTIAVDTLFSLADHRVCMAPPNIDPEIKQAIKSLFNKDGATVTFIEDSPGFVAQRIVATIVNIAAEMAQRKIASPTDIDLAVTLGLGYPAGPLALGNQLQPSRILTILESMYEFYGDPRYRPSPWLKRRALLNLSLQMVAQ